MSEPAPTPFEKFRDTLKRIVGVPREEMERREKAWQKRREKKDRPKAV